jgi:hypothetical protein
MKPKKIIVLSAVLLSVFGLGLQAKSFAESRFVKSEGEHDFVDKLSPDSKAALVKRLDARSDKEVLAAYSADELEKAGFSQKQLYSVGQLARWSYLANELDGLGLEEKQGEVLSGAVAYLSIMLRDGAVPYAKDELKTSMEAEARLLKGLVKSLASSNKLEFADKTLFAERYKDIERGMAEMRAGKGPSVAMAIRNAERNYIDPDKKGDKEDGKSDEKKEAFARVDAAELQKEAVFSSLEPAIKRNVVAALGK